MSQTTITILVKDGDYLEWMDRDLPTPTEAKEVNRYGAEYWNDRDTATPYQISFAIDGYFGTTNGKKYLHDTAAKIAYALNGGYTIAERSPGTEKVYKLSRFDHLERVPTFNNELEANAWNGSRNEIFNAIRQKAYRMFKTNTLNLEALTLYGDQISNGSEHVKYLAPNIFNWVESNYTGRQQSTMTRREAALNASSIKAKKTKSKIFVALGSAVFFSQKSLSSDSKILKVSRVTFKKYLEEWDALQYGRDLLKRAFTPYAPLVYTTIEAMLKSTNILPKYHATGEPGEALSHSLPVSATSPP